jgi:hypothetical protein
MFANPTGGFADAIRTFNVPLEPGRRFLSTSPSNFRNGTKGSTSEIAQVATIFNFNVGGDQYTVNTPETGQNLFRGAYSANTFQYSIAQTDLTSGNLDDNALGRVSALRRVRTAVQAGVKLYVATNAGGDENNLTSTI